MIIVIVTITVVIVINLRFIGFAEIGEICIGLGGWMTLHSSMDVIRGFPCSTLPSESVPLIKALKCIKIRTKRMDPQNPNPHKSIFWLSA